jgi:hypothetical protein
MARTTPIIRALVDRVLGGGLCDFLQSHRDSGDSFATIARVLYTEHDIDVTAETVRVWCIDLGVAEAPDRAAAS